MTGLPIPTSMYITCSVDAVIPTWAFILVELPCSLCADTVVYGNREVPMANPIVRY